MDFLKKFEHVSSKCEQIDWFLRPAVQFVIWMCVMDSTKVWNKNELWTFYYFVL